MRTSQGKVALVTHRGSLVVRWLIDSKKTRLWLLLFSLAIGSLLLYPAPIAWLGLGGTLVGVAVLCSSHQGRTLRRSILALPIAFYVTGAVVGLQSTVNGPLFAEVRLFGLVAAVATFCGTSHLVTSGSAARRLVGYTLLPTAVAVPLVLVLVAPVLPNWYLPQTLSEFIASLIPAGAPIRQAALDLPQMGQRYRLYAAGLGTLAAFGVGLALGPAITSGHRAARMAAWAAVAYFASFAMLSASRAAVLTTLFLVVVGSALRDRRVAAVALLVMGCAGVWAGAQADLQSWTDRVRQASVVGRDFLSLQLRGDYWTNSFFLLGDFWFTGVGLGLRSVETVYRDYFLAYEPQFFHAHNIFVQSYLEQGLLGLLGLLGLVAAGAIVAWRTLRRTREPAARSAAISVVSAAFALVVAGQTEIVALTTTGMVLLFGVLGLLVGLARLLDEAAPVRGGGEPATLPSPGRRSGQPVRRLVIVVAAVLALAALPVALDKSLGVPLPPELKQPVRAVIAKVALNLGALELAKGTLSGSNQHRKAHLQAADGWLERLENLEPGNLALPRLRATLELARGDQPQARKWLALAESRVRREDVELQFQLGRLYRVAGDSDRAIALWNRAGAQEHLVAWGSQLLQEQEPERAVIVYEAAVQAEPRVPEPYQDLRFAAQQTGGNPAALRIMGTLATRYPDVPWPYLELAEIWSQADQPALALECYRRAQEIASRDSQFRKQIIK